MKKTITFLFVVTAIAAVGPIRAAAQEAANPAAEKYAAPLRKIFDYQKIFAPLDPALEKVYPVAIVENKTFFVFEPVPEQRVYRLALTAPDTYDVPVGVRAAMPLAFWEGRIACVVTPEVFGQPDGYVFIFHEFVHCAQWYGGETKLKEGLSIFREAMQKKDYSWELKYPFPYTDPDFVRSYRALLNAWERDDAAAAAALREELYRSLSPQDWEYLTWQEWKEGLARNLENAMRKAAGLPENVYGAITPYDRVTFYVGGDKFIRFLERTGSKAGKDLESLYRKINEKP
ncbi:MAG TPA: hypothetical protein VLJ16_07765, partial [Acidobacteriota bacterium]|nr:hypothetical protein [Acidobacteriota bacterium]